MLQEDNIQRNSKESKKDTEKLTTSRFGREVSVACENMKFTENELVSIMLCCNKKFALYPEQMTE